MPGVFNQDLFMRHLTSSRNACKWEEWLRAGLSRHRISAGLRSASRSEITVFCCIIHHCTREWLLKSQQRRHNVSRSQAVRWDLSGIMCYDRWWRPDKMKTGTKQSENTYGARWRSWRCCHWRIWSTWWWVNTPTNRMLLRSLLMRMIAFFLVVLTSAFVLIKKCQILFLFYTCHHLPAFFCFTFSF